MFGLALGQFREENDLSEAKGYQPWGAYRRHADTVSLQRSENRNSLQGVSMLHPPGEKTKTIGWCVGSVSLDVASVRYRALLPILALTDNGYVCRLFTARQPASAEGLDAMVLVKNFTVDSYGLAVECHAKQVPVIIDLCDNIFVPGYGSKHKTVENFLAVAKLATAIVVTTEPLAQVVRLHLPEADVWVIPDGVLPSGAEISQAFAAAVHPGTAQRMAQVGQQGKQWARRLKVLRDKPLIVTARSLRSAAGERARSIAAACNHLPRRIVGKGIAYLAHRWRQHAAAREVNTLVPKEGIKRLLWFGNHGAEYARFGMLDILEARDALETIAQEFNVELIVISNNLGKFEESIAPMRIESRYLEWSSTTVEACLAQADVVIIPNSLDAFSICKSANRTVHALMHGVPVVATATPALEPLRPVIGIRNMLDDLRLYLSDPKIGMDHIIQSRPLIEANYGRKVIGQAWMRVLEHATGAVADTAIRAPRLVIALHLLQDLDLALPLVREALRKEVGLQVWCSETLLRKSPRVLAQLRTLDVFIRPLKEEAVETIDFPQGIEALICITETNLRPHALTRRLTERANALGILTATLQHGVDNVGLTYGDDVQPIHKVNFASNRIFLWGPLTSLAEGINADTRRKCLPVGCPKSVSTVAADLSALLPAGRPVIGIFENLHWHRYDEQYRQFFLEGISELSSAFPDVIFLVKPHHAGLWLTTRYKGNVPSGPNVYIADPQNPLWEAHTADGLLGAMDAVITSPSTVALDAARRAIPTAVVAHGLVVENYSALPLLSEKNDWLDFLRAAMDGQKKVALLQKCDRYVRDTIIGGPAAARILDDLLDDASSSNQVVNV